MIQTVKNRTVLEEAMAMVFLQYAFRQEKGWSHACAGIGWRGKQETAAKRAAVTGINAGDRRNSK